MMKILVVEDNFETRELIIESIKKLGDVEGVASGEEALISLKIQKQSIIILDLNLPKMDGIEVCKRIRKDSDNYNNPYIIMLTASTSQEDIIRGLKVGADDYIKKPFNIDELYFRVNSICKRIDEDKDILKYKDVVLDLKTLTCRFHKVEAEISKKEFELLKFFIKNKGIILSRNQILTSVWEDNIDVFDRAVDQCVKRMRKKIPLLKEYLKTKKGIGYILD